MISSPHTKTIEEVFQEIESSQAGLDMSEAKKRLEEHGLNELEDRESTPAIVMLLQQFNSVMIWILFAAAAISYFSKELIDAVVILVVIVVNALIGFFQEYKAEKSIQALKNTVIDTARVYRGGGLVEVPSKELVVGDVLALEEGERIPADARLVSGVELQAIESSLTGESLPEMKQLEPVGEKEPVADQTNMVWMGTFISRGSGKAVVVATGMDTAIGKIAHDITSIDEKDTHFRKITDQLARQLGIISFAGALLIFGIGLLRGIELSELFLFSVAVLVSAIPEGLPAILAVVLAIGANRMAKRNAIIRTLPVTESLAVTSVVITDKTGTLTQNTMTIEDIVLADGDHVTVSGHGWSPKGGFSRNEKEITPLENQHLSMLLHAAALCNSARLVSKSEKGEDALYSIIGDPTEGALVVVGEKAGLKKDVLTNRYKIVQDLPFNSDRKYRATLVHDTEKDVKYMFVVGATDVLMDYVVGGYGEQDFDAKTMIEPMKAMSEKAMRVIGFAMKSMPIDTTSISEEVVRELEFLGIVGMVDPIRPETPTAVKQSHEAGLKVVMATGDHEVTALAVAKKIGLLPAEATVDDVYSQTELDELSDAEFEKVVLTKCVFARLNPHTKLRIADVFQQKDMVVAMTGDGVNDAPALKKADIGFAMGQVGTDVAREASDIILTDDNFSSIIKAIEEGRIISRNMAHTSVNLIVGSFVQFLLILLAMLKGLSVPLIASQVLWINLVTSGLSDLVLASEGSHGEALKQPPVPKNRGLLSKFTWPSIAILTLAAVAPTFLAYVLYYEFVDEKVARTILFGVICFSQVISVYSLRSLHKPITQLGIFSNKTINIGIAASVALQVVVLVTPFFQQIFRLVPLGVMDWVVMLGLSIIPVVLFEIHKKLQRES
jgi:Ca2+-transporting ATPase